MWEKAIPVFSERKQDAAGSIFHPGEDWGQTKSSFLLEYFKHLALFGLSSGKKRRLQSTPSPAAPSAAALGWKTFLPWTQINNLNGASLEPEVKIALRRGFSFLVLLFFWTALENRLFSARRGRGGVLTDREFCLLCNEGSLISASGRKWWREEKSEKESVEVKRREE